MEVAARRHANRTRMAAGRRLAVSRRAKAGGFRRGHGAARRRAVAAPGPDAAQVSARALRRPAPAADDRDGAVARSGPGDRRRTHDGAGRHHPGADSRPDPPLGDRTQRRRAADHARPGRGLRNLRRRQCHVCRAGRRVCTGRPLLRRAGPSLHDEAGPCRETRPPVDQLGGGHWVRCYHPHREVR